MEDIELIYSKHCQSLSINNKTVRVEIFSSGKNDWILEIVDENNNTTVWDDSFSTDDEAYEEFQRTLAEEGIESMIGMSK